MKTNIKLQVTPEQSKSVQKICFNNKIYWAATGSNFEEDNVRYIFIDIDVMTLTYDSTFFHEHMFEEVDADLFIRTNGTCEEFTCEHPGVDNTTGKCITCGKHIDKSDFEPNIQSSSSVNLKSECQFAKYGFQKPDFECELLKEFNGKVLGIVYSVDGPKKDAIAFWWDANTGKTGQSNKYYTNMYNLTPIKKPWYKTCKFPCLVWDIFADKLEVATEAVNGTLYLQSYIKDHSEVRLLTNDEIEGLKQ